MSYKVVLLKGYDFCDCPIISFFSWCLNQLAVWEQLVKCHEQENERNELRSKELIFFFLEQKNCTVHVYIKKNSNKIRRLFNGFREKNFNCFHFQA